MESFADSGNAGICIDLYKGPAAVIAGPVVDGSTWVNEDSFDIGDFHDLAGRREEVRAHQVPTGIAIL